MTKEIDDVLEFVSQKIDNLHDVSELKSAIEVFKGCEKFHIDAINRVMARTAEFEEDLFSQKSTIAHDAIDKKVAACRKIIDKLRIDSEDLCELVDLHIKAKETEGNRQAAENTIAETHELIFRECPDIAKEREELLCDALARGKILPGCSSVISGYGEGIDRPFGYPFVVTTGSFPRPLSENSVEERERSVSVPNSVRPPFDEGKVRDDAVGEKSGTNPQEPSAPAERTRRRLQKKSGNPNLSRETASEPSPLRERLRRFLSKNKISASVVGHSETPEQPLSAGKPPSPISIHPISSPLLAVANKSMEILEPIAEEATEELNGEALIQCGIHSCPPRGEDDTAARDGSFAPRLQQPIKRNPLSENAIGIVGSRAAETLGESLRSDMRSGGADYEMPRVNETRKELRGELNGLPDVSGEEDDVPGNKLVATLKQGSATEQSNATLEQSHATLIKRVAAAKWEKVEHKWNGKAQEVVWHAYAEFEKLDANHRSDLLLKTDFSSLREKMGKDVETEFNKIKNSPTFEQFFSSPNWTSGLDEFKKMDSILSKYRENFAILLNLNEN